MSAIGLIYIIGSVISAVIGIYWFYNTGSKEQQLKVEDLLAFAWVAIFAFLVSWVGVISSLLVKYGDIVIIKRKRFRMIDKVQKIIAEIKDRISNYQEYIDSGYDDEEVIKQEELKDLLTFIDSLQEEPKECIYSKENYTDEDRKALCEGCEEVCRFNKKEDSVSEQNLSNVKRTGKNWKESVSEAAEDYSKSTLVGSPYIKKNAFKAGAKWQKKQDQSIIELAEDHAMLAGMEKMKQQMMAKAIDGEVLENYDGKVIKYDETILDEKLSDCKVFDKVKVIVIKED